MEKEIKKNKDAVGSFLGFILLSEKKWDKEKLIKDIKKQWNIKINDEKNDDSTIIANIKNTKLVMAYMDAPVPYSEVKQCASENYMWKEAVDVVERHKAQIIVYLEGQDDILFKALLFTKIIYTALNQKNAIAVYTDGIVHSKNMYQEFADMFFENDLFPILNLVWIGIYKSDKSSGLYTCGLKKMNKKEIEIYDRNFNFEDLRNFLLDIIDYVLLNDVTLKDKETIGFTDTHKIPIRVDKGIALDEETIKIVVDQEAI